MRTLSRRHAWAYYAGPLYRRIKYNQTRQTRVMNQIISDRARRIGEEIIYARAAARLLAKSMKARACEKKLNELQIRVRVDTRTCRGGGGGRE